MGLYALLAVCFIGVFVGVHGYCTQYDVMQCMQPITDYRHKLGIPDDVSYFPIYKLNTTQLDKYCVYGTTVALCLKNLDDCEVMERKLFEGFLSAFHYLCEQTLEEYKIHQRCYAKEKVISGLEECDQTILGKLKSFDTTQFGAKDELCGIVNDDFSCIKYAVKPVCGKEAADWEVTYLKKIISPMMSEVGCTGFPQWAIWIVIGVGSIIVGVLIRLAIMACVRRKKEHTNVAFNNVLAQPKMQPPPYDEVGKAI